MERVISFKLLGQLEPISVVTSATTIAELATVIQGHETLSSMIEVSPKVEGTSKTYVVLTDDITGQEYTFETPGEKLPERDMFLYVTPVTSKFGAEDAKVISFTEGDLEITITIKSKGQSKKPNIPQFTMEELEEIEEKAKEIFVQANRRVNNLPL